MTPRFYTDPLAAAWMAKHFGMELTRTHCHRADGAFGESMRPVPLWILARDVENQVSEAVRYYLHPDSLPLLEPRAGDLVLACTDSPAVLTFVETLSYVVFGDRPPGGDRVVAVREVVRRDGKPFHWPQAGGD